MERREDWLYPERQYQHPFQHHDNVSQKSLSLKKPSKLLASVKGLVHRNSRSVGAIPSSKSAQELSITPAQWPPRSRSLNNVEKPSPWKQRGQTPGMDDYLTLAELETVWVTQDSYVGSVQAPQRSTKYTYVEPVEAPTIAKHQIQSEVARQPVPQLRITTDHAFPSRPKDQNVEDSVVARDRHPAQRPSTAAISQPSKSTSSEEVSPDPPTPPSVTDVRNAVVSGIVHPAFRPAPYFNANDTTPNCRVMSRFATNVPSSNWTYERV